MRGSFFATLQGPGTVWIQSLPFSRLASKVFAAAPRRGSSVDEGGIGRVGTVWTLELGYQCYLKKILLDKAIEIIRSV